MPVSSRPGWAHGTGLASPLASSAAAFDGELNASDQFHVDTGIGRMSPSPDRIHSYAPPSFASHRAADTMNSGGNWRPEHLIVKLGNGGQVDIPYNNKLLGEDLKRHIEENEAIALSRQRIWLSDGNELDDFAEMGTSGVRPGTVLRLTVAASPQRESSQVRPPALPEYDKPLTKEIIIKRNSVTQPIGLNFDTEMRIYDADPSGAAASSGLRKGMQILAVDGTPVGMMAEFKVAMEAAPKDFSVVIAEGSPSSPEVGNSPQNGGGDLKYETVQLPTEHRPSAPPAGTVLREMSYTWWAHRMALAFAVFFSLILSIVLLIVAAAEGSGCSPITEWAVASGILMLFGSATVTYLIFRLQRNNGVLFDPTDYQSVVVMVASAFLVFLDLLLASVGLIILESRMTRDERDDCSAFRDLVFFLIITSCVVTVIIIIIYCTKCTAAYDLKHREKVYKMEANRAAGLPSTAPIDYYHDPLNSRVPYPNKKHGSYY
eukprot:TRINITY_DN10302_c0_g1_i1.p1 TRINITY_DN10302_c0_g1~~TRINITY_DN10302_c0_g1_i1.p1  ORF type:complete len:489 (+),score=64.24 TRINITY_DN10302_c0_g1_i1:173-1639(+)